MEPTPETSQDPRLQVAALCWRPHPVPEILMVTSLRTQRWILPKGWPHPGLSLPESAAREALEEAGVTGVVETAALGSYHYLKEKGGAGIPCQVEVFALEVTGQKRNWPEKGARELRWLADSAGGATCRRTQPAGVAAGLPPPPAPRGVNCESDWRMGCPPPRSFNPQI
jgi:8-oxo-dGTP pyrophosphatase MutT (NUDIX family)